MHILCVCINFLLLLVLFNANRQHQVAVKHHRRYLLRRCLVAWQIYVAQCQHQKELHEGEGKKREKMQAFLQAAAAGKLWQDEDKMPDNKANSAREKVVGIYCINCGFTWCEFTVLIAGVNLLYCCFTWCEFMY